MLQITNLLGEIVTYNKVMCYTKLCQPRFYTFFVKYVYFRAVLGMGDIKDEEEVGIHDWSSFYYRCSDSIKHHTYD